MKVGKVVGTLWCTRKCDELMGYKLLVVEVGKSAAGTMAVCADIIGAGVGERVLIAEGSAARLAIGAKDAGVDAAVVAIVDGMELATENGKTNLGGDA